jgi:hypothetical protein
MTGHLNTMNAIISVKCWLSYTTSLALVCLAGLVLTVMADGQTYDLAPTPYCNLGFDGSPSYTALENGVTSSDPKGKFLAQFVLEAFAQANANNTVLDSASETAAVTALNRLLSMWVPASLNFKWSYAGSGVTDTNAVEFITEYLAQISYRFPKLLAQYGPVTQSGTIENLLATLLAEGQTGALNHNIAVSYTNIWLLRTCNLLLTGQGVSDGSGNVILAANSTVADTARTDLMSWITTVGNYGVTEFLTPTYTGVDLEALGYIYLYATDPGMSAMAQQGSKLLWLDLYANWYNQNQRMGGTHSRTYEFLTDEDWETDRFYNAVSNLIVPPSPAWPLLLTTRKPTNAYWRGQDFIAYMLPPPSDIPTLYRPALKANGSRTILRSFVDPQTNYNTNFMYAENFMANPTGTGGLYYPFCVGSTESFYDSLEFEGLTIMMPGSGSTANVNYNMQGLENYYLQGSAPTTLTPFIAGVQNHAETLFLASQTGQFAAVSGATEVASTIVFPSSAQIWIGTASSPVTLGPGQTMSISAGTTIFLRVSNAGQSDGLVTGIRVLLSSDMSGNTVGLSLVNDGSAYGALRVTCEHTASTPSSGYAAFAVWTRTAYCSDTSTNFNAFRNALSSATASVSYDYPTGQVALSVPGLNSTMTIQANTITQTIDTLSGSDLDSAFTLPLLNVDGTEYVPNTVQDWTSQDIGDATGGSGVQRSSGGLYTGQVQVVGGGSDIWGSTDGFQFYYQRLVGNGTVIGRLTSMPKGGGISPWAKAGLMMRNDLTPGSMNALVSLDGTQGQRFSVRTKENGTSARSGNPSTTQPYWFKITRVNNTFTGYSSPDGKTWSQVGAPATISMNNTIYVGIAVSSNNPSSPISAGFDSVGVLQQLIANGLTETQKARNK